MHVPVTVLGFDPEVDQQQTIEEKKTNEEKWKAMEGNMARTCFWDDKET